MANIINSKAYHLLRRDTLKNWQEKNPLLKSGEICLVTDAEDSSKLINICLKNDTRWSEVDYFSPAQIDISGIDVSGKMDKFGEVESNNGLTSVTFNSTTFFNSADGNMIVNVQSDGQVFWTQDMTMTGHRIMSLGTPTDDADAVNKNYVDTAIGTIDAALGEIITIQNSIVGGGA